MKTTIKRLAEYKAKRYESGGYWFFKTEEDAKDYTDLVLNRFGTIILIEKV